MSSYLSPWDYVVLGVVLFISAGIGVYFRLTGGQQKSVQEYLLANNQMSAGPVAFSLMASFMSAITLLGVSSENYMYGTQFMLMNLSYIVATPIAAYVYLPVFYKLKTLSVYEYLEARFGKVTRLLASGAFSLQMILYMGIVLYAPALALNAVTGLSKPGAIIVIGLVCTFYSTIGGIKAVLITDVFQSILMFAAVYCVIIKGSIDLGGVGTIWQSAIDGGRIEFFNFSLDPTVRHTVFTQVIGGMFTYLSLYAVNQTQVQRLLTVRDLRRSQFSLWLQLPILLFLSGSTALAGLTIYAKYKDCDPLLTHRICQPDQLLPLFVVDSLQHLPGLTGLFIAGILSGSLSTVSSAINSLAAVSWQDYIYPLVKVKMSGVSPSVVSLCNKVLAMGFGLVCIGLAFVAEKFTGVLQASLTIFGVVGGPLLGVFTLGMLFPFTSQRAVAPAFVLALALGLWMGFGGPRPAVQRLSGSTSCPTPAEFDDEDFGSMMMIKMTSNNDTSFCKSSNTSGGNKPPEEYFYLYRISYQWYTLITFTITIVISCLLSLIWPQETRVDETLLSPVLKRVIHSQSQDPKKKTKVKDPPLSPDEGSPNGQVKRQSCSYIFKEPDAEANNADEEEEGEEVNNVNVHYSRTAEGKLKDYCGDVDIDFGGHNPNRSHL